MFHLAGINILYFNVHALACKADYVFQQCFPDPFFVRRFNDHPKNKVACFSLDNLSEAKTRFARGIQISLRGPGDDICAALQATFVPYRSGSGSVWLNYSNARARARLELGEEWNIKACEELVAALGELEMVSDARLVY